MIVGVGRAAGVAAGGCSDGGRLSPPSGRARRRERRAGTTDGEAGARAQMCGRRMVCGRMKTAIPPFSLLPLDGCCGVVVKALSTGGALLGLARGAAGGAKARLDKEDRGTSKGAAGGGQGCWGLGILQGASRGASSGARVGVLSLLSVSSPEQVVV